MQEVTYELHTIRQAHEEAIEAQRYKFQTELEKVRGELQQVEFCSKTLENEMNILRSRKQTTEQCPTQSALEKELA